MEDELAPIFDNFGIEDNENNQALFDLIQHRDVEDINEIPCSITNNIHWPENPKTIKSSHQSSEDDNSEQVVSIDEEKTDSSKNKSLNRVRIKTKIVSKFKTIQKTKKELTSVHTLKDVYCPDNQDQNWKALDPKEAKDKIKNIKSYLRDKIKKNNQERNDSKVKGRTALQNTVVLILNSNPVCIAL